MTRGVWKQGFGWLMYAGNLGGTKCRLITGEVRHIDVEVHQDVIDVTSIYSPVRQHVAAGPREVTISASMGNMSMVEQEQLPVPADIKALLDLARRHPEEYAELREGEDIMRALGG